MSRARLGLYVFGRQSLFENCIELANTFKLLTARPTQLALVPTERYGKVERKMTEVSPGGGKVKLMMGVTETANLVIELRPVIEKEEGQVCVCVCVCVCVAACAFVWLWL